VRLGGGLCLEGVFGASGGTHARGRRRAIDREIKRGLAVCVPDPATQGVELATRGQVAFFEGDFRAAVALLDQAERGFIGRASGVGAELLQLRLFRLWAWVWLGDIDALGASAQRLQSEAQRHGNVALATALAVEGGALVALAADRPDQAIAAADSAMRRARLSPDLLPVAWFNAWVARVHAALYEGRGELAWALVDDHWKALSEAQYLDVQVTRVEAWMVRGRAALGAGRLQAARGAIARLRRERAPYATALADFIEAGLLHLGAPDAADARAAEYFARARRGFEAIGLAHFARASSPLPLVPDASSGLVRADRFTAMLRGWGGQPP